MAWERVTLSQATTIGTHRIVRLPGVTDEEFMRKLQEEVLLAVPIPELNRVTNVVAQELLKIETGDEADAYLWTIYWDGLHRPGKVRYECEKMYAGVREKLELVGVRTSFDVAAIEAKWKRVT
jgi:hypothetical protein